MHEDVFDGEDEVIDGMTSDLKSWTTLVVVHEGTSVDVVSRGGEVGVVEVGLGSDSGTGFVHEDAGEVVGRMENKVGGVIEFEGMISGSGTDSG